MDSVIEVQRQTHEEIERFQLALADILSHPNTGHKISLVTQHKAKDLLDRVASRTSDLNDLYEDQDGARRKEIDLLASVAAPGAPDDLSEFYGRLDAIKAYHAKYPNAVSREFEAELEGIMGDLEDGYEDDEDDPIARLFSGEEAFGRYLDLNSQHALYSNLRFLTKRLGYLQYLDALAGTKDAPVGHELSKECKSTKEYEAYLTSLLAYLISFLNRTQPLADNETRIRESEAEFDRLWSEGKVAGLTEDAAPEANGEAHTAEGIWCPACQKQYSKQTVYDAHLKSKKHIKAMERVAPGKAATSNGNGVHASAPTQSKSRSLALLTHQTTMLLRALHVTLLDTKANVERRFALTARERELELEETPAEVAPPVEEGGAEEEEEERIYNPLKLPLGWDGKPIPYWLYKLHGLGVEYRCEICSDHVYMGRKNFDRHFQESRHAFGMRALGLPNTKHFHEITRIEDALTLAEKLKQEGKHEIFQNETMEELEDDEGNVYSRKTYEDLKKQGII